MGVAVGVEVTATVSAAAGGVHVAVVTMLAVAVSFTELTELAFDATAIWAFREAGSLTVTELRAHEAVPSPLGQPLVNSGFWLDGCAVSVTDTFETDPPTVETSTTKAADCPRSMLDCERWTPTHSSVCEELSAVGLGLAVMVASRVAVALLAVAEAGA